MRPLCLTVDAAQKDDLDGHIAREMKVTFEADELQDFFSGFLPLVPPLDSGELEDV